MYLIFIHIYVLINLQKGRFEIFNLVENRISYLKLKICLSFKKCCTKHLYKRIMKNVYENILNSIMETKVFLFYLNFFTYNFTSK